MALFKKSGSGGLFKKAETKLTKRHGAPAEVPPAGFPTSEDLARGDAFADMAGEQAFDDAQQEPDADTRFLEYGESVHLSSNFLASADYQRDTRTLNVTFQHGGAKTYVGVPPHVALELIKATSPGTYYNGHIKGRYPTA